MYYICCGPQPNLVVLGNEPKRPHPSRTKALASFFRLHIGVSRSKMFFWAGEGGGENAWLCE